MKQNHLWLLGALVSLSILPLACSSEDDPAATPSATGGAGGGATGGAATGGAATGGAATGGAATGGAGGMPAAGAGGMPTGGAGGAGGDPLVLKLAADCTLLCNLLKTACPEQAADVASCVSGCEMKEAYSYTIPADPTAAPPTVAVDVTCLKELDDYTACKSALNVADFTCDPPTENPPNCENEMMAYGTCMTPP